MGQPRAPSLLTALLLSRDGHVSLQEYMAFMISRETENVKSSEEIESAFRALSAEGKPYVTKEELYQVRGGQGLQPGTAQPWPRQLWRAAVPWQGGQAAEGPLSHWFPPTEPDPGTSRLLRVPHEALRGRQGPRAAHRLRLCRIYSLTLCQLSLGPKSAHLCRPPAACPLALQGGLRHSHAPA